MQSWPQDKATPGEQALLSTLLLPLLSQAFPGSVMVLTESVFFVCGVACQGETRRMWSILLRCPHGAAFLTDQGKVTAVDGEEERND